MMKPAELYACLFVREFPAQALLRLRPELRDQACAVMQGKPPLETVCSLNTKACALGVEKGMTRVEIDTFPAVRVLSRSAAEEEATRAVLLECAGGFSPRVEERSDGRAFICVIDIAGTEKLFGAPRMLANTLLERVRALGIHAQVTVSYNFEAAICLARGTRSRMPQVIGPGEEGPALAPLPVSVLDVSEEHAEIFSLWGIRTLGMLAELPEKELISRLGQEGKRLRQLARGEMLHLFVPHEPAFALEERMELDSPVEMLDSLLFVVGVMLEQLILRVSARVLALASVTITLSFEGGMSHTRTVRPALPSGDRQMWLKLIHLDLEAHAPQAAILAVTLTAEPGRTSKVQLGLFSPQLPEPMRLDVTLARIRKIVGENCVGRAVLTDTHQGDAFRMEPFVVSPEADSEVVSHKPRAAMRQLRPAENATVTLCGGRPASFYFRNVRYMVERAYGPWLASGEWWNPGLWSSEQWDLVARSDHGSFLCCVLACVPTCDQANKCWRMMALYD
ncbi:MAG: DNA polymerase Y family protein [Acidobacteriaceae bacterium]|nr:DNA polymerase Y family protein [Acidobacteriaceae bacterium]